MDYHRDRFYLSLLITTDFTLMIYNRRILVFKLFKFQKHKFLNVTQN